MKKLIYGMIFTLCIGVAGCKEDEGLLFNDKARVQLASDDNSGFGDYSYSFIWGEATRVRDTVYLPVRVMGGPASVDRHVELEQVTEYNVKYTYDNLGYITDSTVTERTDKAVANKHYLAFDSQEYGPLLTIPAGKVESTIGIIVLRDASLSESNFRLRLRLKTTADFGLGESRYLERTVIISDMLERPVNWTTQSWNAAARIFGTYSKTKHQLMIQVVGGKVDNSWIDQAAASRSFAYYWRTKFIEALQAYNEDPANIAAGLAPMREDPADINSALVTFPVSVN